MNFQEAISRIKSVLEEIGIIICTADYDGIAVKKLAASNTLDEGRTTNQTHIAITGDQMDLFPYARAEGYFEKEYQDKDDDLKKYFVAQVPVNLYKRNALYLGGDAALISDDKELVYCSTLRSRRDGAADQMQLSMTNLDSQAFVAFRRLIHTGSFIIFLKKKEDLIYDLFAVKSEDAAEIEALNNHFYKLNTTTKLKLDQLGIDEGYWPSLSEYNPGISEETWVELLIEDYEEHPATLRMLKTMLDEGGEATCKHLGDILGEHPSAFVSRGNSLGRRVKSALQLEPCMDGDKERFFPVAFVGRYVEEDGVKRYSWKLRPEVASALEMIFDEKHDEAASLVPVNYKTGLVSTYHRNRILFGAPGTGKSFTLNKDKEVLLEQGGEYERVTFHPDYSYANFVGTYKPVPAIDSMGNDVVTYEYVPGPFMRTLVKALANGRTETVKPYLLIVEEINRANVAAVFGDVFQLLDRVENVSEYPIQAAEDIRKYMAKELGGEPTDYATIQIPDNMFIWATMNSADQGVFPMDTAFKRRWDFTYLSINTHEEKIAGQNVTLGAGSDLRVVEWNKLRKAINEELVTYKINEDKLLGTFFIPKDRVPGGDNFTEDEFKRIFKNKVIMYLYEDAARQKAPTLFSGCKKKLYSEICDSFDTMGVNIFCDSIKNKFAANEE